MTPTSIPLAEYRAQHVRLEVAGPVAAITLDRPERKNPLTFDSYAELRDLFGQLRYATDVKAVVVTGSGGNVTGLTDELSREGLVARESSPTDRRAWIVRLTPKGRRLFETMAEEHEQWILELFSSMDEKAMHEVHAHLGELRVRLLQQDQASQDKE